MTTAALLAGAIAMSAHAQESFPRMELTAGVHLIHAEVATTEAQREQGLMFRKKMGANDGMLFVFPEPATFCMWMKNTLIPLSVAFLNKDGNVINVEEMQPQTETTHCTRGPAQFALEMNRGWFKAHNIKPGSTISGLPPLTR